MDASRVRCLFGLALTCLAACSSSTNDEGSSTSGQTGGALEIFPPHIYSGTDGAHTYKAPIIAVNNSGAVTWTIADPTIASIKPDGAEGENLMITVLKAGTTTVSATNGGKTSTADLNIVAYTPQQYADGEKRYKTGLDTNNPPCMECHAPGKGPDHTATELDADPDEEIQHTFLTGTDPENRPIAENSEYASLLKGKTHMWTVTESEKVGLIAYLRALEPMGFPEYDEPTTEK
jgi:hypothetical protein